MTEITANLAVRFRGTIFSNFAPVRTDDTRSDTTVRNESKYMILNNKNIRSYDTHISSGCAVSYRPYHRGFKGDFHGGQ